MFYPSIDEYVEKCNEETANEPIDIETTNEPIDVETIKCIVEDVRFVLNENHMIVNDVFKVMFGKAESQSVFDNTGVVNSEPAEANSMYDALLQIRESLQCLRIKVSFIQDLLI